MIRRTLWRAMITLIALSVAIPVVQARPVPDTGQAPPALAPRNEPPPPRRLAPEKEVERVEEVSLELAMSKIDLLLRDSAQEGGKETVDLYVAVKEGTDLSEYMSRTIVRPAIFGGTQNIYGQTTASNLLKIAQEPGVLALVKVGAEMEEKPYDPETEDAPDRADLQARLEHLRANELTYAEAEAQAGDVGVEGWYDVLDGHKSKEAWKKGFTGEGVVVGVLDDGIDFAHPDLQGTYARVTDPASPYYGWPMAFSQVSVQYFAQDVIFGVSGIADGWGGSRWTDAQTTFEVHGPFEGGTGSVTYQPLGSDKPHSYRIPLTSQSDYYKLGSFPEKNLLNLYGERVAVLVVDEHVAGRYDTVYVDLDNDYDFTDEKPATKSGPEIYRDMDGDGYADISGGLLVWISDGANVPPTADWLWGITCDMQSPTMKGCPDSGELVLFAGPFDAGYTHGTQCASNIAGQGVVNGGLTAQPFRQGGMVQGAAPDVGLMDFGNHYYTGTDEDEYLVAALGYDGVPNSGDEVQITSNSYGNFQQMWGSWGYYGRLVTALNIAFAPSTVWVFSAGNEGPGYGPQEGDGSPTTIMAGSSTQYGSTNWDSIVSADQIVHGDVTAFFSHGPNRDGSSGVDVLANGGRGAGDEGLNYFGFDGWTSWATWGGTSRSAPVAAGNLALVYQAYKARYGRWPTWQEAKALLKNGATNASGSPFYQGAGVVNADRATDLAAGIYGVYATPDEWQVGDWEGVEYLNFAKVAHPGDTFEKTYTVHNPSGYDITVDLSDGVMEKISSTELSFTTSDESEESGFNFHSPDYLMELDDSLIPADAEVMVVRYVHPYDTFDPAYDFTANPNSSWRYMLYNWTDVNGDGMLWEDRDGNGVVNHVDDIAAGPDNDGFYRPDYTDPETEVQQGEYVRVDYDFGGLAQMIVVRDPLERMADGYFFGWQHRYNDGTVPQTTFKIGLEFYKRADWAWLDLSDTSLVVPAEGEAEFDAVMNIPVNASPGAYEGVIFMNDAGDMYHDAHETALPVVVNVIADLPDGGSVMLGGDPMADTMYQNSWTYGYFNWYGGGWTGAGDWRHYFLNIDSTDLDAENLLIHTSWEDYPTDFNTWVLGPTYDCASNGVGPCAVFGLDQLRVNPLNPIPPGQPNPAVFGPYTLQPIGWSEPFRSGAAYPFNTSTGGPDDWLKVPMERTGLHEIALHQVLYNGEELTEQFQVDIGTVEFEATMDPAEGSVAMGSIDAMAYTETGQIDLHFTPTLEVPDLEATLTGGLATTHYGPFTAFVPDTGACYSAWCAGNVYEEFKVDTAGATRLSLHLYVPANQDADFFLVYDSDDNGVPEQGVDAVVGSSGNAAGTDEDIVVQNPALGRYWAVIDGYDVDPDSGVELDWEYHITAPGPLPTYPMDVFSGTVSIGQDAKFDPTTSSYSMTVTTTDRVAALHATVTDIPAGADVDLYVTDEMGAIVAASQNLTHTNEHVMLTPMAGEYRFEEDVDYTIWVHGFDVPAPPVTPTLRVWWDVHNLWLSATHPDVHPSAIGAGETVSLTLHFDQPGWLPGEHPHELSARLIAGPSTLPDAFDELVTITRVDPPGPPTWSPANLHVSMTADSERGRGPARWAVGGVPIPTAMVAAGERVTYTVELANADPVFDSPNLYVDAWPLPQDYVCTYFGLCSSQVDGADYGLIDTDSGAFDYGGGIEWTGTISSGESIEFSYWVEMPADMEVGQNHTSGADVYLGTSYLDPWINWGLAGGYYRAFEFGFDGSKSAPTTIAPGDSFTYDISLANDSAEDKQVYFSDPLPDDATFVSATGGASYNAGTHTVTWTGLLPGTTLSTVDFQIEVQADTGLPDGTVIENEASLAYKLAGTPFATLEAATLVDDGMAPVLQIEKTVDALTGYSGDTLHYSIFFENTGTETATDVVVVDPIPQYLALDPTSMFLDMGFGPRPVPPEVWDEESGILSIEAPAPIPPGQTYTFTFQTQIEDDAPDGWAIINPVVAGADNAAMVYDSALTEVFEGNFIYLPLVFRNYTSPTKITILHNNDGESDLLPGGDDFGGVAHFASVVDQVRTEVGDAHPLFLVTSGDNFLAGPEWTASVEKGVPFYDSIALDLIGYDAMCLGNHDFDFGPDTLADFIEGFTTSQVPFLSANLDFSEEPALQALEDAGRIAASIIVEDEGEQFGIVGATTPNLTFISSPRNVVVGQDVQAAVQAEIDALEAAGVNMIILISHLQGIEEDLALAPQLSGLDIMIAGGGDELLANPGDLLVPGDEGEVYGPYPMVVQNADGADVPVVTTSGQYEYLGRLEVSFDGEGHVISFGGGPIRVAGGDQPDAVDPDPQIEAQVVDPVAAFVEDLAENVIATSEVPLDGRRNFIRSRETNEGDLIADSFLWKATQLYADYGAPAPDVAMANGGGIRNDSIIAAGDITELDTFDMLPFPNFLTIVPDVTPEEFKELVENVVSRINDEGEAEGEGTGRFAQIAGFSFTYDSSLEAGSRVLTATLDSGPVMIAGGAIAPTAQNVNIAIVDFLARGGDEYFGGPPGRDEFFILGTSYQQALADYIESPAAEGGLEGLIPEAQYPEGGEGRITNLALSP